MIRRKWAITVIIMVLVVAGSLTYYYTRPEVKREAFKIGAVTPVTGMAAYIGEDEVRGIEIAVEEINEAGGVLGREVVVIYEDNEMNPDKSVLAVTKLIEIDKVNAIVGFYSTASVMAVCPTIIEKKIPLLFMAGGEAMTFLDDDDYVWRVEANNNMYATGFAKTVWEIYDYKSVVLLTANHPWAYDTAKNFKRYSEEVGLIDRIVGEVFYDFGMASYRSELEKVNEFNPEVAVSFGLESDINIMLTEKGIAGYTWDFIGGEYAISERLIELVGEYAEGLIVAGAHSPEDTVTYKRFLDKFKEKWGYVPIHHAWGMYDAITLISLAAERAGDISPTAIRDNLREVSRPPGEYVTSFKEGVAALRAGEEINYEGGRSNSDLDSRGDVYKVTWKILIVREGKLVGPMAMFEVTSGNPW